MVSNRWNIRVANDCLFVDDAQAGRIWLQHNVRPGGRPYIHPLRVGDGKACLTEDSPGHHPWQHGIQTGIKNINGCDFWHYPGSNPESVCGTIEPDPPRILGSDPPQWHIEAIWRHIDGTILIAESQSWSFREMDAEVQLLELDWTLLAITGVELEHYAYGGLYVRMPYRDGYGAEVINSAGQRDDDAEHQAATWVDLFMRLDRSEIGGGITVCDHPENPNHPAQWRVDGQRGINPSPCIGGAINLTEGEALRYRYRLIAHAGRLAPERIQDYFDSYAPESTA